MEKMEPSGHFSLLNLPEPILDFVLKLLSPVELVIMSEVCTCLRDRCRSDPLWEVHLKHKWGGIFGDVAYKEWQWHITTAKEKRNNQSNQQNNHNGSLGSFSGTWPVLHLRSYLEDCSRLNSSFRNSFKMVLYFCLENGKFWFPAQIYRGGFVRDTLVGYDSKTDNFEAREQNGGWHAMGNRIQWEILRAPPTDTPPCVRYVSDCLEDLKPGDHIEIQKRSREISYDWWYAVVGHMESCNENQNFCRCGYSDTLVLEFKQYNEGSSMGRVKLLRNEKEYEEATGCYGGIRKLQSEEIQRWEKLLPLYNQTPMPQRFVCRRRIPTEVLRFP